MKWLKRHLFELPCFTWTLHSHKCCQECVSTSGTSVKRLGAERVPTCSGLCMVSQAPLRLWWHTATSGRLAQGRGKGDKQQQTGSILSCHGHCCDECVPINLAMTQSPVEMWPKSNDTDVSYMFIAKKL